MFNGKIDFMDFKKIRINHNGKLTLRGIFKSKFIFYLLITIIFMLILISIYSSKNKNISNIISEISELNSKNSKIETEINLLSNKMNKDNSNLNDLNIKINQIDITLKNKELKLEEEKKKNKNFLIEKEELEKKINILNKELKTEKDLKDVYNQKISSLKGLLESSKTEYKKLLEKKGEINDDKLNIIESKIINLIEVKNIEKIIKGKIKNKCFDGIENNFNSKIFHEKCDNNPLIILIKTDNKERIGAFTKVSFDGNNNKKDPSSALFNIDKMEFYILSKNDLASIICNPNQLPQFGNDLKILNNGYGNNEFPNNYGNINKNKYKDLTKNKNFKIENLEIYKVDLQ